ncbi:HET-domain-containing protein [Stipitochalara longipes BDJ]|nr:HET-domain-containing protein [Stipitochalara longipes BDJ]
MLYTRLDFLSYEIRLLNILEGPYDESVHCNLEKTTLTDPGSYHALSYCWGDLRTKKTITINDTVVEVGHNLEAALRQLRLRGHLRIWIDALCINQSDNEERGLQIRNMRQIYSQALYVISWLGDDPDNIANAVKYLFENERYVWFPGRRHTAVGFTFGSRGGMTEEQREWDTQRWRIFQSFFELDYWRRVWVIQEIASSHRVKVLFGHTEMDWKYITYALDHWKEHSDKVPKACASYEYAAELDHFRIRYKNPRPIGLFEAIQWSHYALATEQLDKIYALLGLTFDGPRLVPVPNYQRTFEQILCDLTGALLTAAKSSNMVDLASTNSPDLFKGWPRWDAKSLQLWSELNTALGSPFCSLNPKFSYIAAQPAQSPKSLQTRGILLGQVCQISHQLSLPEDSANKPKLCADNMDCQKFDGTPSNLDLYPSGIPAAILKTLCLYRPVPGIDPQSCLNNLWQAKGRKEIPGWIGLGLEHNRQQWDYINRWLQLNSSFTIGSSTLEQWSQLNSKTNRLKYLLHPSDAPFPNEEFGRCIETITKALQSQMCLMVTQTGLIGMAPSTVQVGDWVCYIRGLNIPAILREKKMALNSTIQEYHMIGGVYVHLDAKLPGSGGFGDWAETYFVKPTGLQSIVIG